MEIETLLNLVDFKSTMEEIYERIIIIKTKKPESHDINKDLQWFSRSLGLFSDRDKEKSCFRIFIELVKASKEDQRLKSNDIAERSHLTRATVIHHLNNLMERGLVISKNNKYLLRENNFEELLEDIEKDFTRIFKDLKRKARELDKELETF